MQIPSQRLLTFPEVFLELIGAALPLPLPNGYAVLETSWHKQQLAEMLIGSEHARLERMHTQGDVAKLSSLPQGFFLAGFHPHSRRSLAFYWCQVDGQRRVFFRFPTVATPSDGEVGKRRVLTFCENFRRLFEGGYGVVPSNLTAHDAMGDARYRLELGDGRTAEHHETLLRDGDFGKLVAKALRSR